MRPSQWEDEHVLDLYWPVCECGGDRGFAPGVFAYVACLHVCCLSFVIENWKKAKKKKSQTLVLILLVTQQKGCYILLLPEHCSRPIYK